MGKRLHSGIIGLLLLVVGCDLMAEGEASAFEQAMAYWEGKGVPENPSEAVFWFRRAAYQDGIPEAYYYLGKAYREGKGTIDNLDKAALFFSKASEAGIIEATYELALCYLNGAPRLSESMAASLMEDAAEKEFLPAIQEMGRFYEEGIGVRVNFQRSAFWKEKAAGKGSPQDWVELADAFFKGEGVPQDYARSAYWYDKAAQTKNAAALYMLARQLEEGLGVTRDRDEAFQYYEEAARRGELRAYGPLANLMEKGIGTNQNPESAARLYYRAYVNAGDHLPAEVRFGYLLKAARLGDPMAAEVAADRILGTTSSSPAQRLAAAELLSIAAKSFRNLGQLERADKLDLRAVAETVRAGNPGKAFDLLLQAISLGSNKAREITFTSEFASFRQESKQRMIAALIKGGDSLIKEHPGKALQFYGAAAEAGDSGAFQKIIQIPDVDWKRLSDDIAGSLLFRLAQSSGAEANAQRIPLLRRAVERNHTGACLMLAEELLALENDQPNTEIVNLLGKASAGDNLTASVKLAQILRDQGGGFYNPRKSGELFLKVGKRFLNQNDPINACHYFLHAAGQGNVEAKWELGTIYQRGIGVEKNVPESLFWFAQAAREGNRDAAIQLQVLGGIEEPFYRPDSDLPYHIPGLGNFATRNLALRALADNFNASVGWITQHMGPSNDAQEIRANLQRQALREGRQVGIKDEEESVEEP